MSLGEVLYSRYDRSRGVALQPFDAGSLCPKCGGNEVTVRYVANGCQQLDCATSRCAAEHLARTCQRCYFQWPQAVAR